MESREAKHPTTAIARSAYCEFSARKNCIKEEWHTKSTTRCKSDRWA